MSELYGAAFLEDCADKVKSYMERIKVILPEDDLLSIVVLEILYLEFLYKQLDRKVAFKFIEKLKKRATGCWHEKDAQKLWDYSVKKLFESLKSHHEKE